MPLGTTAHKQGRVAGENAAGGRRTFAGALGTQVVKVVDLAIARTGLRDDEARAAGFDPVTVASAAPDHNRYYPGAHDIHIRLTGDRRDGRLLGAQLHRTPQRPRSLSGSTSPRWPSTPDGRSTSSATPTSHTHRRSVARGTRYRPRPRYGPAQRLTDNRLV